MLFRTQLPLVLASASPRRRELLASLGADFEIMPADAEPLPNPGELPHDYAVRAAKAKCAEVAARRPDAWVLGADSVVAVSGEILGKPADEAHALEMLSKLCGGDAPIQHVVCTGCSLQRLDAASEQGSQQSFAVSTLVTMAPQLDAVRKAYVATGEPMDKAGAYAIQGLGSVLVKEIRGSYTNVVGLPLAEVLEALLGRGIVAPRHND